MKYGLLNKIKIFIYSVLSGFRFNLGGQLGANEVLALVDSLSFKKWAILSRNIPDAKKINIAYIIFLFAQAVSDLVNHSSPANFIRGWANIAMAIVVTSFLMRNFLKTPSLILLYLIGEIVKAFIFGQDSEGISLEDMGFFKFQLVPIINAFVLILSWFLLRKSRKNLKLVVLLFLLYGLFCIAFDARSNSIFWILTAIILLQAKKMRRLTTKRFLPYLVVFALVFQGLYTLYVSSVISGDIGGEHAKDQFEHVSNPYNPLNLLLVGRSETFVAMSAIADAPIFGHGSWALDKDGKYTFMMYQMHNEENRFASRLENSDGTLLIPSHSVLMGSWASAGILGFLAVMYIFILVVRRCISLFKSKNLQRSPIFPIVVYFFFNMIWTFIFSPLPHIKQTLPVMIALIIVLYQKSVVTDPVGNGKIKAWRQWKWQMYRKKEYATITK